MIIMMALLLLPAAGSAAEPGVNDGSEGIVEDVTGGVGQESYQLPDLLADDPFNDSQPEPGSIQGDAVYDEVGSAIYDPLEPVNRVFFVFNDKLYFWVIKPVSTVYGELLPVDIRQCIGNFFTNLAAPVRLVNNLLQGEVEDAAVVAGRFVINTVFGIGGLGDPALRDFDLEPRGADLGQTLGKWGIGEGLYLFWPILGPSNLRDTFGVAGDTYLHPATYLYSDFVEAGGHFATERINVLSLSPDVYEEIKRMSLDPYVASRQAFYDYRRAVINKK